jgi:hypothetical protein
MNQLNIDLIVNMYQDDNLFEINKHRFSEFTHSLFKKYNKSKKGMASIPYKIKSALFLDYLIKFYHLPKIIKAPPEVLSKQTDIDLFFVNLFLEKFAESCFHIGERDKNTKSNILILKNTYHILVLALMLSDYKVDYSLLAKSMKLDEKQLYNYYKEIGCKLTDYKKLKNSKNNLSVYAELDAPLKLNLENNIKYGNK